VRAAQRAARAAVRCGELSGANVARSSVAVTALGLHDLSDVLPSQIHVSVPASWRARRLRIPPGVIVHHADVAKRDRSWFGAVPATAPGRTLQDCAYAKIAPDLLRQAAREALHRRLVGKRELVEVKRSLRSFGGLAA
jgi:predicted transcriptional regulator of viral defense system